MKRHFVGGKKKNNNVRRGSSTLSWTQCDYQHTNLPKEQVSDGNNLTHSHQPSYHEAPAHFVDAQCDYQHTNLPPIANMSVRRVCDDRTCMEMWEPLPSGKHKPTTEIHELVPVHYLSLGASAPELLS